MVATVPDGLPPAGTRIGSKGRFSRGRITGGSRKPTRNSLKFCRRWGDREMTAETKPIIVVHPTAATIKVRRVLEKAGYAVVVAENPELFKVLESQPLGAVHVLTRSALEAILAYSSNVLKADFADRYIKAL